MGAIQKKVSQKVETVQKGRGRRISAKSQKVKIQHEDYFEKWGRGGFSNKFQIQITEMRP